MADWNKNNRACKTTWFTLFVLNQLEEAFPEAGALTMKQLTFFTQTGDADMRKVMARSLAIAMDNNFRLIRGAKFEKDIKPEVALQDMVDTFVDETKTVADLAAVNDKNYLFLGETHDDI
ncbi:MAG TPA: hypothetical protein VIW21_00370 [Chthoniobacterales bacterium]|jgi:hypothetical protein